MNSILETERLRLRPYAEGDVAELVPLIGAREVAATTLRIPHPYSQEDAKQYIAASLQDGENVRRVITLQSDGRMIGGVGLHVDERHEHAELGYWLAAAFWGQGYATEAARAMVQFGFEQLRLNRIFATHFGHNPASGRVLLKLGMRHEGCQRAHYRKWDQFLDSELYGILRQEWAAGEYNG